MIARLAVPRLADWCFVELLQADGSITRAAIEATDADLLTRAREYDRRYPLDPSAPVGSPQVIRSGVPDLQPEIPDAMLQAVAQDEEHLELLRSLGFRSSMIVPLRSRGRIIGDLALVSATSERRFGEADLAAAQELAVAGGLYLENARLYRDLRLARDELEAILAGVADAVTVQGPDGRLVYVNEAAVRLLGFEAREALLSATPAELMERFELLGDDGRPFPLDRLPGRLALQGLEPEPLTVRYRAHDSGQIRWSRVKARPMRTPEGGLLAINVIEDITDLKQAEETQRLLADAGRVLAGSLDFEETLRRVAWLAVPELADWCMVDLLGDRGLQRVAAAHADPARAATAKAMEGLVIDPDAPIGVAAVARTGRSELHTQVAADHIERAAFNPHHAELLRQIGIRSQASVPMTMRGQRLGVITLATTTFSDRRLGAEQLAVAEELGRRAAVAVDGARLYRQRSAIARTLQESLLPPHLPEIAGLETGALYRAAGEGAEVGGDFYDLFSVAEDEWIAVIGDVCGKGAEAAAVTALARYTIRTAAVRRRSPAAILRWLNDEMLRQDKSGRFCTITCVHLDLAPLTIRATVACGGHPPALLVRGRDGAVEEVGHARDAARDAARPHPPRRAHGARRAATRSSSSPTASPRRAPPSGCWSRPTCGPRCAARAGSRPSGSWSSSRRSPWARRGRRRATTSPCWRCAPAAERRDHGASQAAARGARCHARRPTTTAAASAVAAATAKPELVARDLRLGPAAERAVRAAASGTTTARPSAVPICALEVSRPEARPWSASSSAAVPRAVEATDATPRPAPSSTKPPASDGTAAAPGAIASSARAPAATPVSPAAIARRSPIAAATRGPANEPAITARLKGGNSSPAVAGGSSSTSCA